MRLPKKLIVCLHQLRGKVRTPPPSVRVIPSITRKFEYRSPTFSLY